MRVFYFDIDGTVRDYQDQPFAALAKGELETALNEAGFQKLVCLSGLVWLAKQGISSDDTQRISERLWTEVADIFPDKIAFIERLEVCPDPDKRAASITMTEDWYYADDWADKFFSETWGHGQFQAYKGKRICQVDPYGDGSDLLGFIRALSQA